VGFSLSSRFDVWSSRRVGFLEVSCQMGWAFWRFLCTQYIRNQFDTAFTTMRLRGARDRESHEDCSAQRSFNDFGESEGLAGRLKSALFG